MTATKLVLSLGAPVAVAAGSSVSPVPSSDLVAANPAPAALTCDLTQYKAMHRSDDGARG